MGDYIVWLDVNTPAQCYEKSIEIEPKFSSSNQRLDSIKFSNPNIWNEFQKEKEIKRLESKTKQKFIAKITQMLKVSTRIELEMMQSALDIDRKTFSTKIFKMGGRIWLYN